MKYLFQNTSHKVLNIFTFAVLSLLLLAQTLHTSTTTITKTPTSTISQHYKDKPWINPNRMSECFKNVNVTLTIIIFVRVLL